MPANSMAGYVYFVYAPDVHRIKIGYSSQHPDGRLSMLRSGSAGPLDRLGVMVGGRTLERKLHARYRHLRTSGEWFRPDRSLLRFIARKTMIWWPIEGSLERQRLLRMYPSGPITTRRGEKLAKEATYEARLIWCGLRRSPRGNVVRS